MNAARTTCRDVTRHLCGNLDERINSPACRRLKKHLEQCPNCAAFLDSLKKTVRLYREYPSPRLPAGRRKMLMAVLRLH